MDRDYTDMSNISCGSVAYITNDKLMFTKGSHSVTSQTFNNIQPSAITTREIKKKTTRESENRGSWNSARCFLSRLYTFQSAVANLLTVKRE